MNLIDIGCGVGGDMSKYYYIRPNLVVCLDVFEDNIYSATNGAESRYINSKKNCLIFLMFNLWLLILDKN